MENEQNIDEHFKRSLQDFKVQPKLRSFDMVMQKMERRKKRRLFFVLFFSGLVLFSGLFWWFSQVYSSRLLMHSGTITQRTPSLVSAPKTWGASDKEIKAVKTGEESAQD